MSEHPTKILMVEDNPGDARLVEMIFAERGAKAFELTHVTNLADGISQLSQVDFNTVLLDLSLPDSQGLETVQKVTAQAPTVPLVVLTGLDNESVGLNAINQGAQDFLVKGKIDGEVLSRTIRYAIERKKLQQDRERLIQELQEALANIKTLKGMIPICASCKKIRDDKGYWDQVEVYVRKHSEAEFSHGLCPICFEKAMAEIEKKKPE